MLAEDRKLYYYSSKRLQPPSLKKKKKRKKKKKEKKKEKKKKRKNQNFTSITYLQCPISVGFIAGYNIPPANEVESKHEVDKF